MISLNLWVAGLSSVVMIPAEMYLAHLHIISYSWLLINLFQLLQIVILFPKDCLSPAEILGVAKSDAFKALAFDEIFYELHR